MVPLDADTPVGNTGVSPGVRGGPPGPDGGPTAPLPATGTLPPSGLKESVQLLSAAKRVAD